MSIICKHCGSLDVRGFDNQPLYHPSEEEVKNGVNRFDNEIYVEFICDKCGGFFQNRFQLVLID